MYPARAALALLCCITLPGHAQQPAPAVDSMALRAHTWFLASDLLEGRATGSRGADLAAAYLASSAERLGLVPAGPGGWLQDVPLVEATIDTAATTLTLIDSSGTTIFRSPVAFIPNAGTASTLVGFSGELAWVGEAADILAHPERLPVLTGRIAIMGSRSGWARITAASPRSEEHTSELQSRFDLVCRLLLEKQ